MSEPPQAPVLMIEGEQVALGPQRREHVPLVERWLNDLAVVAPLGGTLRPLTTEEEILQYEETSRNPQQVWFAVYERATLRPIGISGLRDLDQHQRTAEFVIFIGEQECWGKGYGTETAWLILDYGFTALGLHNIMLRVFSFNVRGIRAYRRAGFREVGRRRQAFRLAGRVYDTIFMDCLASEFESPVLGRLLPP